MYTFNTYNSLADRTMPQVSIEGNDRMSFRIASSDKSVLMRAAALQHTSLTEFVVRTAMTAAQGVIDENERMQLSKRDTLQVLDLLETPPVPNKKLLAAAVALPKDRS